MKEKLRDLMCFLVQSVVVIAVGLFLKSDEIFKRYRKGFGRRG